MYDNSSLPAFTKFMFASGRLMTWIQVIVMLALWIALVVYVGGPRLRDGLLRRLGANRWASPWTLRRLQRDFSAMLAVLLDSGLTETDSVRLAAEATASPLMRHCAEKVCVELAKGVALPDALQWMDRRGELSWRIKNALRHRTGFLKALAGWHEALDAKAFQLEQATAQVTTSALVLVNGAIVACIVIGVFMALIRILNDATLW
jgi:type II secretory pathway component PulF